MGICASHPLGPASGMRQSARASLIRLTHALHARISTSGTFHMPITIAGGVPLHDEEGITIVLDPQVRVAGLDARGASNRNGRSHQYLHCRVTSSPCPKLLSTCVVLPLDTQL